MKAKTADTKPSRESPARAQVGGALDHVNDGFHDAYAAARGAQKHAGPVFVVIADELVVFRGGKRAAFSFSPRAYHVIKSISHAPVALYSLLTKPHDESGLARHTALRALVTKSLHEDALAELPPEARDDAARVLRATSDFLARPPAEVSVRERDEFAGALGASLLRLARDATALQLEALHAHVEHAISLLTASERDELEVVVTGDHQARARSLAMQYFRKRLREPDHAERRVTYAEGVSDEHAAVELVGTRRLDRLLAGAFFGDAHRLQRDVLGDAAHELVETLDL